MALRFSQLVFVLLAALTVAAQDSITVKEAELIRFKAERLINRELPDLLNNIANTASDEKALKEMITNSHSGKRNKIFYSPRILVDDDINPAFKGGSDLHEVEVERYLNDFDVLYAKSEDSSVSFSDLRVSHLKKRNYLYVNVFYSSLFSSRNKTSDLPYSQNNRVAEIRVEKVENNWVPYIARLGFFDPSDTANDISNILILKKEFSDRDSISVATIEEDIRRRERERLIREQEDEDALFKSLIDSGEEALQKKDFTEALDKFSRALDLRNDQYLIAKIHKANKDKQLYALSANELHEQYLKKARIAESQREYEKAIQYYNSAIEKKPETRSQFQPQINQLTERFRIMEELGAKYHAGLYKEAIKQYEAAMRKDPKNSDYYVGRGMCFFALGQIGKAQSDYDNAYQLDPQNLQAIELRAELFTKNKDYFKAQTDYKTYLTINKTNPEIYEKLAAIRLLINSTNFEQALADLDEGIAADPKQKDLYLAKGGVLMKKQDFKNAITNFSLALKIDSNYAFSYYQRGRCNLALQNIQSASNDFATAREKGIDSIYRKNIELLAQTIYDRAITKRSKNELDSSLILVSQAILINPYQPTYHFTQGDYYYSLQEYKQSISSFSQAIGLKANYTEAWYRKGDGEFKLGEIQVARESYTNALKLAPKSYQAQKGMGDCLHAQKEYAKALEYLEAAIFTMGSMRNFSDNKFFAEAHNTAGKCYFKQQQSERAINAFRTALKKNPEFAEAYFNKGLANFQERNYGESAEDLAKAITLDKSNASYYYQLGRTYQAKKDFTSAISIYTECLKYDSMFTIPRAIYNRGVCYAEMKKLPEAINDYLLFQQKGHDTTVKTFDRELARLYFESGKYDTAIEYYDKSLKQSANDGYALYGRASSVFALGNVEEALNWLEKSFQAQSFAYKEIKEDKMIQSLKKNKRFKDLVNKYY